MLRIIGISNYFFFFVKKQNRLPIVLLMSIFFSLTLFNQPRCSTITEHKCSFFMLHTVAHIHSWRLPNATAV